MFDALFPSEQLIYADTLASKGAVFDKTVCKVGMKLHWSHSASDQTRYEATSWSTISRLSDQEARTETRSLCRKIASDPF
jgi:hypothetical protein